MIIFTIFLFIFHFYFVNQKFIRKGISGIDIWRWIHYSLQIKNNRYKLPDYMKGYLDIKPFNYPPLFLWLMSLFPKKIIENKPYIIAYIFFLIECIVIIIHFDNSTKFKILPILFILSITYDRLNYFSTRPLASLIMTLIFCFLDSNNVNYSIIVILFILLFFSHRHSLQFIFFFFLFYSFFSDSSIYFLLLVSTFCFLLAFSIQYRIVFLNHYAILSHYFELINIGNNYELVSPFKFDYKRFINNIFISKFIFFLIIFYATFTNSYENNNINFIALIFISIYTLFKCFKFFSFLGEPERNFDYILFPIFFFFIKMPKEYQLFLITLSLSLLFARYIYNKYNYKNIYRKDISLEWLDVVIAEKFGQLDSFNFMSYPALYDDYVNYKYDNSLVFFHDNGLSGRYSKIKYIPEFINTNLPQDYFNSLFEAYKIDLFVIHKSYNQIFIKNCNDFYTELIISENIDFFVYARK